jgi:hypothetical protein
MQFGAYTFVETRRDPLTGVPVDVDKSFADVLEQIELADRVGLDVFGLGEHHRPDYAVSAPAVALAAAAARTKRIRLTSAVTVLSSDDPVRVYQQFATLDLLSGGRAEIMAGAVRSSNPFRCSATTWKITTSCSPKSSTFCSRSAPSPRSSGPAGIARRSTASPFTRGRCSSRCRSGSPRAARRNRSPAQGCSACRWRSRSSAASRAGNPAEAPATDITGAARGNPVDVGAYSYDPRK